MKRKVLSFLFLLSLLCSLGSYFYITRASTMTSTTTGGYWSSPTSWVGGVVPSDYDNVIINGPIIVQNNVVNDVFIGTGGKLTSYAPRGSTVYTATLDVKGNITNNGTIYTGNDGIRFNDLFNLSINGNINNNGSWSTSNNILYGGNTKTYSTSIPIGGNNTLNDDFEITGNPIFLGNLFFNGKTLNLNSNTITLGTNSGTGNIGGTAGKIQMKGNFGAIIGGTLDELNFIPNGSNSAFNGSIKTNKLIISSGAVIITQQATIDGNLINNGTLTSYAPRGSSVYTAILDIKGNFINNANVYTSNDGIRFNDLFNLNIKGNITNNGNIGNNSVILYGGDKEITGNPINAQVIIGDNLSLISDTEMNGYLGFNPGKKLTVNAPYSLRLNNGSVNSASGAGIIGNGEIKLGGQSQTIGGELTIGKLSLIGTGTKIVTNLIVNGDLEIGNGAKLGSYAPRGSTVYTATLDVKGNITNNGTIYTGNDGIRFNDLFNLSINGNINNNGSWSTSNNILYGGNTKTYSTSIPIGGPNSLNDNFEITGNPIFGGNLNFNGKILTLNGNEITIGGVSGSGIIGGANGKINIKGTYGGVISGNLNELSFTGGNISFNGGIQANKISIASGTTVTVQQATIDGNLINNGTLTSYAPRGSSVYTAILDIKGNFINNANVYTSNDGIRFNDLFYIKAYGSIENNKSITANTYLKWASISGTPSYYLNITGLNTITGSTNESLLASNILTSSNKYWYVTGYNGNTSSTTPKMCINVPGCIKIDGKSGNTQLVVVNYNTPVLYNNNAIVAKNVSAGPTLLASSTTTVKKAKTESTTTITQATSEGDPVNLTTGEFDYDNALMHYTSKGMPFDFKIRYKNQAYYNGIIGNNFDFNYNQYLTEDSSGNIDYHDGKLGAFRFEKTSTGFVYNDTLNASLSLSGSEYMINFSNQGIYTFGDNAKIKSIKDLFGNEMKFVYNSDKVLTKIIDTLGREYTLGYYDHTRLKDITDFIGNKVEFTYFGTGETTGSQYDLKNINMVNGSAGRQIGFTYTTGSTFESAHNIIQLIDSENNIYVENTYDANDRVLSQKYGNGTIYYNYTLDVNNKVAKNTVTDREGHVIEYYYNSKGNTTRKIIKKVSGNITYDYEYDTKGNLIKEIKPLGNGTTYKYDINNNIIEKRQKSDVNATGSVNDIVENTTFDLSFNKPTQTIDPNGIITNFTYDMFGNLTKKEVIGVTDSENTPLSLVDSFVYNGSGELIQQTNANGLDTAFEYASGNLIKATKGTGNNIIETAFVYDTKGNMIKSIDARGNETILSYDEFSLVLEKLTPELVKTQFTYNNLNKKTTEKLVLENAQELKTVYSYDILDNITKTIQDIDANHTLESSKVYDTNSRVIEEQIGNGAKIQYVYDENGLLKSKKIVSGSALYGDVTTSYTYDGNERLIKEITPNESETTYTYDGFDRVIKKLLPNSVYEKYTYNVMNNVTKKEVFNANNKLLSLEENIYDQRGKVLENKKYLVDEIGNIGNVLTSKMNYDVLGNVTKTTDSLGNISQTVYDDFGRVIETIDAKGNKAKNFYDDNNNITKKQVIQSNGITTTTTYVYDKDNRVISETNNDGKTKTYVYNKLGQVTQKTDEKGNIVDYEYNYAGKVLKETKHLGNTDIVTQYVYDTLGNMIQVTDSEENTTQYEYDILNRLVAQIYPNGKEVVYVYDKNNNLVSKTDPNGTVVTNTYDSLNRLISKNISAGTGVEGITGENYSYDDLGRLLSVVDSDNHALSFTYDSLNRLVSENNSGEDIAYGYDENGNVVNIGNIHYTYDELGRVVDIVKGSDSIAHYSYSGLQNTSLEYGNGKTISQTFDTLNRISSLDNGIKLYNYTYDDVGNIHSDSFKNYVYDDLYRVQAVNSVITGSGLESFSYDKVGNRTQSYNALVGSGENYEYTKNSLNQYTSLSGSISKYIVEEVVNEIQTETQTESGVVYGTGLETSYSGSMTSLDDSSTLVYDDNGNIISNGKYHFVYDYKNRMVKVSDANDEVILTYSYDALDRRYKKETSTKIVEYIYANENIAKEKITDTVSGNIQVKEYINGLGTDNLIAYELDGNRFYFHKNHLGSIDGISDSSGNVVVSYDYDVFGNIVSQSNDFDNERLYTSREFDSEIGLYYMRARYYDAKLGRFISRDPIDIKDDVNLYAYVRNNSVMFVDLRGTEKALAIIVDKFKLYGDILEGEKDNLIDVNISYINITNLARMGNIKINTEVRENAKFISNTCNEKNENPSGCGKMLTIGGQGYWLTDFGNLLFGYNAQKAGFSLSYAKIGAGLVNLNNYKNPIKKSPEDYPFYEAGFLLAKYSKSDEINGKLLLNILSRVYEKNQDTIGKYRLGETSPY